MADVKISDLAEDTSPASTSKIEIEVGGVSNTLEIKK